MMDKKNCKDVESSSVRVGFSAIEYEGVKVGETNLDSSGSDIISSFATTLAQRILKALEPMVGETFFMRIGEWLNHDQDSPDWTIELTNAVAIRGEDYAVALAGFKSQPEKFMQLFATNVTHPFIAIDGEMHTNTYGGWISVEVIMFADEDHSADDSEASHEKCRFVPNRLAESIAQIALCHYYVTGQEYYTGWQTHYMNAPETTHAPINNV